MRLRLKSKRLSGHMFECKQQLCVARQKMRNVRTVEHNRERRSLAGVECELEGEVEPGGREDRPEKGSKAGCSLVRVKLRVPCLSGLPNGVWYAMQGETRGRGRSYEVLSLKRA